MLLDTLVSTESTAAWWLARVLRACLITIVDPPVRYRLGNDDIGLPLSHPLPIYRRRYPCYGHNLGSVASILSRKYREMSCIDIGANVGDSAAIIRASAECAVLCVEAEPQFLDYLRRNAIAMKSVTVAPVFIAAPNLRGALSVARGTARIRSDPEGAPLPSLTMGELTARYPEFSGAKLVKIDTDGMDRAIILASLTWLSTNLPTIFFEFDPKLAAISESESTSLWSSLRAVGYQSAAIFENTGEFLLTADLADERLLLDVHRRYADQPGSGYADICVFSTENQDLANEVAVKACQPGPRVAGLSFRRGSAG